MSVIRTVQVLLVCFQAYLRIICISRISGVTRRNVWERGILQIPSWSRAQTTAFRTRFPVLPKSLKAWSSHFPARTKPPLKVKITFCSMYVRTSWPLSRPGSSQSNVSLPLNGVCGAPNPIVLEEIRGGKENELTKKKKFFVYQACLPGSLRLDAGREFVQSKL